MYIQKLKETILTKDSAAVLAALGELKNAINGNDALVDEITNPTVITELHNMQVEQLGVHPRMMMLRTRVPGRVRRAVLFVQAMENGVKRAG